MNWFRPKVKIVPFSATDPKYRLYVKCQGWQLLSLANGISEFTAEDADLLQDLVKTNGFVEVETYSHWDKMMVSTFHPVYK